MIQKLTITNISRFDKDPQGNPLTTAKGPYTRVRLRAAEHGEQWISGFGGAYNSDWKAGDEVTVDITKVEKDGKTYINFSKVNTEALVLDRVNKLEATVEKIRQALQPIYLEWKKKPATTSDGSPMPDFGELPEEITEAEIANINPF